MQPESLTEEVVLQRTHDILQSDAFCQKHTKLLRKEVRRAITECVELGIASYVHEYFRQVDCIDRAVVACHSVLEELDPEDPGRVRRLLKKIFLEFRRDNIISHIVFQAILQLTKTNEESV